uniref:Cation-transporting ATPase n=1 Tax=Meloidogyne incognita TaxID=6306 RepID=A0A914M0I3_MELIC
MAIDQLIENVSAYRRRPIFMHAFITPFLVFHACWLGFWQNLGFEDYWEFGCIIFVGILILQALTALFCYWFVEVDSFLNCVKVNNLVNDAQLVKVKPTPNNGWTEFVPLIRTKLPNGHLRLSFCFQKIHYRYNEDFGEFKAIAFNTNLPFRIFQDCKGIENEEKVKEIELEYGNNRVEMEVPKFAELFTERATAPFFIFQVFCVGLWCLEDMWYYSLLTLFMLVTFEVTIVKQQMRNMSEIRNMGSQPYLVNVYRGKRWNKLSSDQLICGDIISITSTKAGEEKSIPCDLLLLRGHAICDEAMLTGESIPQMKESIEELERERIFDSNIDSRLHVLFGGTKILQHTPPAKNEAGTKAPDNGVICYVLRTGFNTNQGSLLRTIMFGVKRVSANNLETFAFILFLLIFAIAASAYLWVKGTEDENRSRYKLFLECVLILTSVIPPELPIELSLAVNNSLLALQKLGIFCTEPFRIPFAGKIDVCCFDKTGTLTTDELVMEGVAGLTPIQSESSEVLDSTSSNNLENDVSIVRLPSNCDLNSVRALASCHSLVRFDEELVGDPLEKAILKWLDWNVTKQDSVIPIKKTTKVPPIKILRRFHFSSQMKRMTVISAYQSSGQTTTNCIVTVKGAPEILRGMFHELPLSYDENYQSLARAGARIIALGIRELGPLSTQQIRETPRNEFECELSFAGFAVVSCPLKSDTRSMIREIIDSSHRVVMITGDNVLTALHVANELKFIRKNRVALILDQLDQNSQDKWLWRSVDGTTSLTTDVLLTKNHLLARHRKFELCLTGSSFENLHNSLEFWKFRIILENVRVYARMSPKQKEKAVNSLKRMGFVTLMCGDGTNDVGALKHSEVGVALLSHPIKNEEKSTPQSIENKPAMTENDVPNHLKTVKKPPVNLPSNIVSRNEAKGSGRQQLLTRQSQMQNRLDQMMREMEQEEQAKVRLGDASYAAPFTSKSTSIQSICNIIKQGRCTLVTTMQMFKILALNALVLAYSQSVLYLDGVKFSDTQATVQGIFLAACFLFISRSKPLRTLSKQRPMANIFNVYTLTTITLQFSVHFACLIHIVKLAHNLEERPKNIDLEKEFKPNLLNTAVYLMSSTLQIATFAVNYRGKPFMESLTENRPMFYSIICSFLVMVAFASNIAPEMNNKFELVHIPELLRNNLVLCIIGDLFCCFLIDRFLNYFLGDARIK